MADAPPPVTPTWGPGNPPPGKRRRKSLLLVLVALVLVAGVAVGLMFWVAPPRAPATLPVWITAEPGSASPVPWAAQDRAALLDSGLLGRPLDDPAANPNRDQIRLRFQALSRTPKRQPVVVYVAAPASVDAAGTVYILPADPLGDHPRNRLPLADLLAAFKDCPARHRLLVLHLTPPHEDPLYALPPGELSAAVFRALDGTPDAGRLCLVACGPGEVPHGSADLGRTVFAHYLEAGLRGAADGWGGDRDGHVTVNELAAFVRARASRWATTCLRSPQTPVLVGTAADFTLRSYARDAILEHYPTPPAGEAASGVAMAGLTFPDWLKAGWERHDQWLANGRAAAAPRALALLRHALLTAERDLLAGRPAAEVQQSLDRQLAAVDALAAKLAAVPTPDPLPTLAAAFPGYVLPEPTLLDELRAASTRADAAPPPPPPEPGKPGPPPTLPADFEPLKAKAYPLLALAAFRLLAEDPPTAAQVRRLSLLLATKEPVPKFAEVVLIQRLATLADPATPVPWSPARAALALQTARDFEQAAVRADGVAIVRSDVEDAYRLRADAEALLFAPGFAPPAVADERLRRAAETAGELKEYVARVGSASAAGDEALTWLAGAAPAVEAGLIPSPVAARLTAAAHELRGSLGDTPVVDDLPRRVRSDWAVVAADLRAKEDAVRAALAAFTRPLRPDAVARVRARLEGGDPGTVALAEADALLLTPLLPAADRAALWNARAALARRLSDAVVRTDATEDESYRRELSRPVAPDPRDRSATVAPDAGRLARRSAWTAALLGTEFPDLGRELTTVSANAPALAARLKRAWLEDAPQPGRAAFVLRVAPPSPALAFLDQPDTNREAVRSRRTAVARWGWYADRFAYEARNPADPQPTDAGVKFAAAASRACAAVSSPPPAESLDIAPPGTLTLAPTESTRDIGLRLRSVGTARRDVTVRALTPSEEWVRTSGGGVLVLDPAEARTATVTLAVGNRPEAHPELKGVLVEVEPRDGGRPVHRRVPVELGDLVNRLTLTVKPVGEKALPVRAVELRPNAEPQQFELRLGNPGKKPQTVIIRLPQYDRETEKVTVEPEKDVKVRFRPPPPPAPVVVPPGQPVVPVDPFEPVRGNALEVVVIDPAEPDKVRQRFTVPVAVLDPADYLRVEEVTFTPAIGSRPNRLALEVVPNRVPPGPPVPVTATLPRERNPDVVRVQDANLSAPLPATGRPLTLYAESTAFAVAPPELVGPPSAELPRVVVTVAADGVERVFTFAGSLPPLGGTVRLNPVTHPMVRVRAKPLPLDPKEPPAPVPPPSGPVPVRPYVEPVFASGLVPLPLELEVDNAPDGATVQIRLGSERVDLATGNLAFTPDVTLPLSPAEPPIPAKDRNAKLRFDPKGEALIFKGTLADPAPVLPVEVLVGRRVIEARLIGRDGKPLLDPDGNEVVGRTRVVFDAAKPTGIEFIGLQPRMPQGKALLLRATSDQPVSGVKEVNFFPGRPVKDGPPPGVIPVPGVLFDPLTNEWRATLPIEGLKDKQVFAVQFVSKAGQLRAVPVEVELVDPAELNKPPPGTITGVVTDNDFKQKGLKVFLYDAAAKPVKEATTTDAGVYEFRDVPAGAYFVYAYNVATRREAKKRVDLKPGAREAADLVLMLNGKK